MKQKSAYHNSDRCCESDLAGDRFYSMNVMFLSIVNLLKCCHSPNQCHTQYALLVSVALVEIKLKLALLRRTSYCLLWQQLVLDKEVALLCYFTYKHWNCSETVCTWLVTAPSFNVSGFLPSQKYNLLFSRLQKMHDKLTLIMFWFRYYIWGHFQNGFFLLWSCADMQI